MKEGRDMRNKIKPHKGLLKRVKISAKGKIIRHKACKGHLMSSKTGTRRRHLGKAAVVKDVDQKRMRRMLGLA
jgi:large subunit ribosomal protein L35